jgi:hypothetical protein
MKLRRKNLLIHRLRTWRWWFSCVCKWQGGAM